MPAGGINDGEAAEDAVVRELAEESGVESASIVRKLGETWYLAELSNVPAGLEEQIQHAFHLRLEAPPAEVWEWDEKSGGDVVEHRFAFRWVSLDDAGALLWRPGDVGQCPRALAVESLTESERFPVRGLEHMALEVPLNRKRGRRD